MLLVLSSYQVQPVLLIILSSTVVSNENVGPVCMPGQVRCTYGDCIPEVRVCDGVKDCFDEVVSDENQQSCPGLPINCRGQKRRCNNTNICVDPVDMCDGYDDCGDMSDENSTFCHSQQCAPLHIRCKSTGQCIPETWQCDGAEDCVDGSDESSSCRSVDASCQGSYVFECDSGKCINRACVCDGEDDCFDNSDEDGRHNCGNQTCSEFSCESNHVINRSKCIPHAWVCDGEVHCAKAEDESPPNCNRTLAPCNKNEFRCANGRCVHIALTCNNINNCLDNSDESDQCQPFQQVATKIAASCEQGYFRCGDEKCIQNARKCDTINDCSDGTDESMCIQVENRCTHSEFRCHNGQCIQLSSVCNEVTDCDDYSDESELCGYNECDNAAVHICEHTCVNLPVGYECRCNLGYRLNINDNRSCVDINECTKRLHMAARCIQKCENTPGSFRCICDNGFKLLEDGMTCEQEEVQNHKSPWILLANVRYIQNISADGRGEKLLAEGFNYVSEVAFDSVEQMIYVLDNEQSTIYRFKCLDNTGIKNRQSMEKILTPPEFYAFGIQSIAVDWVGRKLYFLSKQEQSLFVCELNGTSCTILLDGGIFEPGSVVVSPETGYAFISNWGMEPYIGRIGLDGSHFIKIVKMNVVWPNDIAVDYLAGRIYWADIYFGKICSVQLDGSGYRQLDINVSQIYSVAIIDHHVYWTDRDSKGLFRANKLTGENVTLLATAVHIPYAIQAVRELRQPQTKNPCGGNNGNCSHLCLIGPGGQSFRCACPYRLALLQDQKTCSANLSMAIKCRSMKVN